MMRRWVVQGTDDTTVGQVVARLGAMATAIAEGRVFIAGRRATRADEPVAIGDEIVVEDARSGTSGELVELLGEARDVLAVYKPAGLPTEPDRHGNTSLLESVGRLARVPVRALHAATRLDASVSGVVLVARGAAGARTLDAAKRSGRVLREYLGLAAGPLSPRAGTWTAPIGKEGGKARASGSGARPAETSYEVLSEAPAVFRHPVLLVRFRLRTGRLHQIRVHSQGAGAPLLGDVAHGGPGNLVLADGRVVGLGRVMLHAARVVVTFEDEELCFRVPPPAEFRDAWASVSGDAGVLAAATPPCGGS